MYVLFNIEISFLTESQHNICMKAPKRNLLIVKFVYFLKLIEHRTSIFKRIVLKGINKLFTWNRVYMSLCRQHFVICPEMLSLMYNVYMYINIYLL